MALTVTNINTLTLLNILNKTSADQSNTLTQLSTGSRINSGRDDPAGLLALSSVQSKLIGVNAAIGSNQRTDAILGVADSALGQVGDLLGQIKDLAAQSTNSAGLSADQLAANQAQIDNAITSIDRIIHTTEFEGKKLLDGSMAVDVTGADATKVSDVRVYSRDPNANSNSVTVRIESAATQAATSGSEYLANNSADVATTISVRGRLGTQIIDIGADEALSSITAKINDATGVTGVVASQTSDTAAIHLRTDGYGSDEFVKVSVLDGGTRGGSALFQAVNETGTDAGVSVNGQTASADGKQIYYNMGGLSLTFSITDAFNEATAGSTSSFVVSTTGGATFQLGTDASTRSTVGIDGIFSQQLGSADLGYLSSLKSGGSNDLRTDAAKAVQIADAAGSQLATLRGRVGGFQKYQVAPALATMTASQAALTSVKSSIADVDYAKATADLNRQQVLMQTAISLLGVSNQQASQILSLLR